ANGIENAQVEHAVDADLDVVLRDAHLLGNVDRLFLQRVLVRDALDERNENVKAGLQRAAVLAEHLDDVGALLRHDDRGLRNHDDHEDRECDDYPERVLIHKPLLGGRILNRYSSPTTLRTRSVSPSTASMRASAPAGIGRLPTFTAVHNEPRYSARHDLPGASSSGSATSPPTSLSTVPSGLPRTFS